MPSVTIGGTPFRIHGPLPAPGSPVPDFVLTATDFADRTLADFAGRKLLLNLFMSLETPVCSAGLRRFNAAAAALRDTAVLCVSADLPFAHHRFCAAEGIENVTMLSTFRSPAFARDFGIGFAEGPDVGLLARGVVVAGADRIVRYCQLVAEIGDEPDYDAALAALTA